jgi:hypothetical protein
MNNEIEQYNGWYKIEDIESSSDDAIVLNRKEIISLINTQTVSLQKRVSDLSHEIKDLRTEIARMRDLNEREKNIYVRSRIPFRFTPDHTTCIKQNYDLPFKLFTPFNKD